MSEKKVSVWDLVKSFEEKYHPYNNKIIILDKASGFYKENNITQLKQIYTIVIKMSRLDIKYEFVEIDEDDVIKLGIRITKDGKTLE